MLKALVMIVIAAGIGYAVHAFAQLRTDLRPAMTPVTSSSSNGASFAWFYDPAERSVVACRIGPAAGDQLECKARSVLP